jgi:hypothetical protein
VEGVAVPLLGFGSGVAPAGVGPAGPVPAVQVGGGVDRIADLLVGGQPGVGAPVDPGSVEVEELRPVDADTAHGGQPPVGAQEHAEMGVVQPPRRDGWIAQPRQGDLDPQQHLIQARPAGQLLGSSGCGRAAGVRFHACRR